MECPICGDELKVIVVMVPVYLDNLQYSYGEFKQPRVLARYEERKEVCDCPRCKGAY